MLSPARRPSAAPLAVALVASLALAPDDSSAAALRQSASTLGALSLFAMLLLLREWPVALTGSLWAAGVVAAAIWLLRARVPRAWLALPAGWGVQASLKNPARVARVARRPAVDAALVADAEAGGLAPEAVLAAARACFGTLQAAWDAGDIEVLRAHTTAEMLGELLEELPMRGSGPNRTDILALDAALLGLERLGPRYLASVEFSGTIRESDARGAEAFREVWMLTCEEVATGDWRLARQQALL